MSPINLMEGAIKSVTDWLKDQLPVYVQEVNELYGYEPFTLVAPVTVVESELDMLPPLPALVVIGRDIQLGSIDDGDALEARNTIDIAVVDTHPNQEHLRKMLYRHTNALVRAIRAGERAGEFKYMWASPMVSFSPIIVDENDQILFADAHLALTIMSEETE